MANKDSRWPENSSGRYYVDDGCIRAKFCVAVAPDNFRMSERGHSYVCKQPMTSEEERRVREAMAGCPVGAIGDDREE